MMNIVEMLNEGKVEFSFTKINGEKRDAVGTTNLDLIPASDRTTITNSESSDTVTYYDLGKNAYRTFRRSSVTRVAETA